MTALLQRWRDGDKSVVNDLMSLVYPRLREMAGSVKRDEAATVSLQTTALVHEAYLRLLNQRRIGWKDREHFFSFSARVMRFILVDHARGRLASKRGGAAVRVPLHENMQWVSVEHAEILDLNRALDELEEFDARKVRAVELRYFLGCTAEETAEILGISKATADRDLEVARAWLFQRLKDSA